MNKILFSICFILAFFGANAQTDFNVTNITFDTAKNTLKFKGYNPTLGGDIFNVVTGIASDTMSAQYQETRTLMFSDTNYLTTSYTNLKTIRNKRVNVTTANIFLFFDLNNMYEGVDYTYDITGINNNVGSFKVFPRVLAANIMFTELGAAPVINPTISRNGTYTFRRIKSSVFITSYFKPITDIAFSPYYVSQNSGNVYIGELETIRRFTTNAGNISIIPNTLLLMVDEREYTLLYEANTSTFSLNFLNTGLTYRRIGYADATSFSTTLIGNYKLKKVGNICYVTEPLNPNLYGISNFGNVTTTGLRLNRLTTAEINAAYPSGVPSGILLQNTTTNSFQVANNTGNLSTVLTENYPYSILEGTSATDNLGTSDYIKFYQAASSTATINFPSANLNLGKIYVLSSKKTTISLTATSGTVIDIAGTTVTAISTGVSANFISNGTNWIMYQMSTN